MIAKTRQPDESRAPRSSSRAAAAFKQGCGVLRHPPPPGRYAHVRHPPPDALADWIEHFWVESWDFRGCSPQTREVLPHPCVHMVFAHGRSRVWGVQLGRFVRELRGRDRIFGAKFHAGAFYPFLREPVCSISNASVALNRLFDEAQQIEDAVLACAVETGMVTIASRFLADHLPPRDPNVETVHRLVGMVYDDRRIMRVEQLAERSGIPERTLQRLFRKYVGAPVRWVIKRCRIYEVLERLELGGSIAWAALAQDLGYFDQAHFANDFKRLVGCPPSAYASCSLTG